MIALAYLLSMRISLVFTAGLLFVTCLLGRPHTGNAQPSSSIMLRTQPAGQPLPSRQELMERYYNERKLLVVFGTQHPDRIEPMRKAIQASSWSGWRRFDLTIQHAAETSPDDLKHNAVLLVGNPQNNPFMSRLEGRLPLSFGRSSFTFVNQTYDDPLDVLTALYPSPDPPEVPTYVIAGFDDQAVMEALDIRLERHLDYQVLRGRQRLRIGTFSQETHRRWQYDPQLDQNFEDDIVLVGSTELFRYYAYRGVPDHALLSDIILARESTYKRVRRFFGGAEDLPSPMTYVIYPSLEQKALVTKSMEFAHADVPRRTVHIAIESGIRGDLLNRETLLLTRDLVGTTPFRALEDGLSIMLGRDWHGEPYPVWMNRIAKAGLTLPARALLDNSQYQQSSPLLREPMAASLIACMIDEWGKDNFLDEFSGWQPSEEDWPILEDVWAACIETHRSDFTAPVRTRQQDLHPPFQKGFNFAHEGYSIIDGYGSREADRAIEKLADMGGNALALIPYTGMRDPGFPVPFRFANSANDENDGSVAHAARFSQELGFTVMLKPQIWVRGSWPGDLDMQSEEHWDLFFAYYEHWIGHYAMLAELFEIDILCIGTELRHATMKHEDRWIDMANRLRSVYSGQLVYASNWGEEFENLAFWDAFDYIGLNSYYPLSDNPDATESELRAGAERVVARIEDVQKRFNKPLLLTEIGFPSSARPWILPYEENRQEPANTVHQALCYRIMIEALSDEPWLSGIYWWKWPSHLERGGATSRDRFTPNGKPAADVVRRWYQEDGSDSGRAKR